MQLILRLRFHVLTIFIATVAGTQMHGKWQSPLWEREGRWWLWLPALVAGITWFRGVVSTEQGGLPAFLFLGERVLVAYLAFAIGLAIRSL